MDAHYDSPHRKGGPLPRRAALTVCFQTFCLFGILSSPAVGSASTWDAAVQGGVSWLLQQQDADGRLSSGTEPTHAWHATQVAWSALVANGAPDGNAGHAARLSAEQYLASHEGGDLPWALWRWQVLTSQTTPFRESPVWAFRTSNGGFSAVVGGQPSLIDSISVLAALNATGVRDPGIISPLIEFILGHQASNGGFRPNPFSPASIYLTAHALHSLAPRRADHGLAAALESGMVFLQREQSRFNPYERAMSLLAMLPLVSDPLVLADVASQILADQSQNGSWGNGQVFTTAWATQALRAYDAAVQAQTNTNRGFSGRVIDSASGLGLAGVWVRATDTGKAQTVYTQTQSDGSFLLSGLTAGIYSIQVVAEGYAAYEREWAWNGAERLDLGALNLSPSIGQSVLFGHIRDAQGEVPAGTVISLNGVAQQNPLASDGSFALGLASGVYQVQVTAPGYHALDFGFELPPMVQLQFSPVLVSSFQPETGLGGQVIGRVVDAGSGGSLAQVLVRREAGTESTWTDHGGEFVLSGLPNGVSLLSWQAPGYQTTQRYILAHADNNLDLGVIDLLPSSSDGTSIVYGHITDATGGHGIAGARIVAAGRVVLSDANGAFQIPGIATSSFELEASAVGYRQQTRTLTTPEPAVLRVDMALEPVATQGIRIAGLHSEQSSYQAWQDVPLSIEVENQSDQDRAVLLLVQIRGPEGQVVAEFPVPVPEQRGGEFILPANTQLVREFHWFTRNHPPGSYQVRVQMLPDDRSSVLAEGLLNLSVEPTRALRAATLASSLQTTTVGSAESFTLNAELSNGSNVDTNLVLIWRILTPDESVVAEDTALVSMPRSESLVRIDLATMSEVFSQIGYYRLELILPTDWPIDTVRGSGIEVLPRLRLEPALGLDPAFLLPGSEQNVRVWITLEGLEEQ